MPHALQPHLIRKLQSTRGFHTSSSQRASVLFALGALSNSRETQHFNKITRLSRVEHSPTLKLIQTSEVDPFPLPEPTKQAPPLVPGARVRTPVKIWNDKALKVGRAILADNARQVAKLSKALERAKRRQTKSDTLMQRSLADWAKERQKMHGEIRQAGVWILAAVGTATGLAMWRFWPQNQAAGDSVAMGRKIAEKAHRAMPLPPATNAGIRALGHDAQVAAAVPLASQTASTSAAVAVPKTTPAPVVSKPASTQTGSWWKNMFWKLD